MLLYKGYTTTELTTAVNDTLSVPPLTVDQLQQVLYHCEDTLGNLTANAFCIDGCDPKAGIKNDQCIQ
jgi:hypothetical protein